ncbi:MAG: transposase [Rhodobacteraceae bacterium]|nr:transposase [Paracoccaceae bacterium]
MLVGANEWGRTEILGLAGRYRETTRCWRELLLELKRRGLSRASGLAAGDGAPGFRAALREVFGNTCEQRGRFHKTGSVLNALRTFHDFPAEHWQHIRTTNPIESACATVRHRTGKTKGCLNRKTGGAMTFRLIMSA